MDHNEVMWTLENARILAIRILQLKDRKKEILSSVTSTTSRPKDVIVSGGGSKDQHSKMDGYLTRTEELDGKISRLYVQQKPARELIAKVESDKRREALKMYYLKGMIVEDIAKELHCTVRNVFALKSAGILDLFSL